jgi:tetratricopeptide (TPR) repeat protein
LVARGSFYQSQGLEARGTAYIKDTPEENIRAMRAYLGKARIDLERSLNMTQRPYLSHRILMSIARTSGNRKSGRTHYLEAVKLAPQSVELRLAYMTSLEPRWGGSYAEMEAFVAESRSQLKDPGAVARLAARIPADRADERQRAKDFAPALKLYDEAIGLYPGAGTLCERSYVLSQLKRDAEAFADVKLALSKSPDNRYCLERAVAVASGAGNADEAIGVLNLVIEVDPNSVHAINQRGWRYQQQGIAELAFKDFLASARLGDGWGQLMTGKYYWAGKGVKEDREEALAWLRKAAAQGHPDAKLSLEQALQQ